MIPIQKTDKDDSDFLDQLRWITAGCLDQYQPTEVYVIRIRDWFDYKWCYFTGKRLGAFGVSNFGDLTLPPFVPNRVLTQDHYNRSPANGDDYKPTKAPQLHIQKTSGANFNRFIRRTTNNGTIIWFSSGSISTGRGSIMIYNVSPEIKFGWHVTFLKKTDWQIEKVSFTSRTTVEALRNLGFKKFPIFQNK